MIAHELSLNGMDRAVASVVWTDGEFPSPVKRDQQQAAPAQPQVAQDDLPF